ncbi:MAG: hypothetical protein KDJ31_05695 [Candidatus Competibacteraceae bacterium]|nr:hypothetical protein [Candidatus Competibacteraceae bacterium]MCB1821962.1 hypothetical protein [Candidatus Competibacteraceae bacterium]HRY14805.1 hypothetical protein [Candidatus Competibacteraceae bacterium]
MSSGHDVSSPPASREPRSSLLRVFTGSTQWLAARCIGLAAMTYQTYRLPPISRKPSDCLTVLEHLFKRCLFVENHDTLRLPPH